jgi:hypothetical protein
MRAREINVGDVWRRRCERHDEYDRIRVCGCIFNADERPDEWTISPADEFGAVIGTTAAGILDHCDLVTAGTVDEDWA